MSTNNRVQEGVVGHRGVDRFRQVSRRLIDRTAAIETRMNARLEAARLSHDLDARALLSSHRHIAELTTDGKAPTAVEFWSTVASPRAQALTEAASIVIDDGVEQFKSAAGRFETSVGIARAVPGYDAAAYTEVLETCIETLAQCRLDRQPLDRVGAKWQARLRRAATRRLILKIVTKSPAEVDLLRAQVEMSLFDQPPWSHDDRLLAAFELAHADVRSHLRDRLNGVSVIVPRLAGRQLGAKT